MNLYVAFIQPHISDTCRPLLALWVLSPLSSLPEVYEMNEENYPKRSNEISEAF